MSTIPSAPVLRGPGDSVIRLEDTQLYLRLPREDHRIPLAAIASVRTDGRSVVVVLTGAGATEHRIDGVAEDAAAAFAEAVTAVLPADRDPAADGDALVSSQHYPVDVARVRRRRLLIGYGAGSLVVGLALAAVLVVNDQGSYAGFYAPAGLLGTLLACNVGHTIPSLVRLWKLPKHGVTTHAVYSHINDKNQAVYVYTDPAGDEHMFLAGMLLPRQGVRRIAVSHDPDEPGRAVKAINNGRGFETMLASLKGVLALALLAGAVAGTVVAVL